MSACVHSFGEVIYRVKGGAALIGPKGLIRFEAWTIYGFVGVAPSFEPDLPPTVRASARGLSGQGVNDYPSVEVVKIRAGVAASRGHARSFKKWSRRGRERLGQFIAMQPMTAC